MKLGRWKQIVGAVAVLWSMDCARPQTVSPEFRLWTEPMYQGVAKKGVCHMTVYAQVWGGVATGVTISLNESRNYHFLQPDHSYVLDVPAGPGLHSIRATFHPWEKVLNTTMHCYNIAG